MNAPSAHRNLPTRARQEGAALFVSMIMLLLLLMLAVAGMRTVTLESRIGGNMLESQRLHETADGALREGERTIQAYGLSLATCATGAAAPFNGTKPCYISEARSDALGVKTSYTISQRAASFKDPFGYWYPRYIATMCPKGSSATAALESANTGCTEFYEVNAQATLAAADDGKSNPKACGPEALCLRSSVNLFIK